MDLWKEEHFTLWVIFNFILMLANFRLSNCHQCHRFDSWKSRDSFSYQLFERSSRESDSGEYPAWRLFGFGACSNGLSSRRYELRSNFLFYIISLNYFYFSDVYEALKQVLYMDDAVSGMDVSYLIAFKGKVFTHFRSGEAAGLAMGLVMLGSNSESAIHDMLSVSNFYYSRKLQRKLSVFILNLVCARHSAREDSTRAECWHCPSDVCPTGRG